MHPIENILLKPGDQGINRVQLSVPFEDYHELPAMNPSTLVKGLIQSDPWQTSMKHLRHAWECPREDTDDFLWGRAVHCLLFEPTEFENRYTVFGGRRAGNEWKDFLAIATEAHREVLTTKQWDSAQAAAISFVHEPLVQELIAHGQAEVSVQVVEDGMQCRGRLDWVSSAGCITDLKTTKNITPHKFGRDFYAYRYDIKLGLYRHWWQLATGQLWPVKVIALEKCEPWDVAVITIPDAVLDYGAEKGLRLLAELKQAIETNLWHGVAKGEELFLDVPSWEMEDVELEGAEEVTSE